MKNQTFGAVRSLVRKMVTPAVVACMLIASSIPCTVNATEKKLANETPVEVTYLGKVAGCPLFQIKIDNIQQEDLYVTLKDEYGNVLYAKRFKDTMFSKKFQFNNVDLNNLNVTMTIVSKNERRPQVLTFSNVTKTVEDVVVTRVH